MVTLVLDIQTDNQPSLAVKEIAFRPNVRELGIGGYIKLQYEQSGWYFLFKSVPLNIVSNAVWSIARFVLFKRRVDEADPIERVSLVELITKETITYPFSTACYRYLAQDGYEKYNRFWQPLFQSPQRLYDGYPLFITYLLATYGVRRVVSGKVLSLMKQCFPDNTEKQSNDGARMISHLIAGIVAAPLGTMVVYMQVNSDREDFQYSSTNVVGLMDELVAQKGWIFGLFLNGFSSVLYRSFAKRVQ